MRKLVINLDDLLTGNESSCGCGPDALIDQIKAYQASGFDVVLVTTADGLALTPDLLGRIEALGVSFEAIEFGVPDTGPHGLYLDDKVVTPSEFVDKSFTEITALIGGESKGPRPA